MRAVSAAAPGWGVLYMAWGERAERYLQRSVASLAAVHPELPVHVARLPPETDPEAGLIEKAGMFDLSPFENTLFLDVDTVVLDRLDHAFAKAARFGLACAINECPWARRYDGLAGDLLEYNTGVLFFTAAAEPVFRRWAALAPAMPSATRWNDFDGTVRGQPYADQASFAVAVEETGFNPHILPLNYNLRPSWHRSFFMPVKIWHDYADPPARLIEVSRRCAAGESNLSYMELVRDPQRYKRGK